MGSAREREKAEAKRAALRVATIYVVVAGSWILFSDQVLLLVLRDPQRLTSLQTVKGLVFVLVTAGLLVWLVQRYIVRVQLREESLHQLSLGASVASGEALFNALARNLATALDVDCAMVCELTGAGKQTMRTLAAYCRGEFIDNFECRWAGTPCEKVLEARGAYSCRDGVRQRFPDHPLLEEWAVESFIGTTLTDSAGRAAGLLMVLDSRPLQGKELADEILPFFALRAAVELDRKRAVEELQESESLLRVVFDQAFQLLGLMKPDGTLVKINRTAAESIRVAPAEVLGKPFWETPWWSHSPELQQRLRDAVARAAKGEFVRFEATHPTPEGGLVHVDFSIKPVVDEKGRVVLLVPEGRDITERKRAEEVAARLASIVESSEDAIIGKTLDGVIVDWNPSAEQLYGYSAEEIRGQPIDVLVPTEHHDRMQEVREKIRRVERIDHYESVHLRKDGRPIHVSLTVSPVRDASGRLVGSSTIARDISRRKELEEALRSQFEQITTIFDSLDAVVYAADLETSELLYLNRYGISVFRPDWQGKTCCDVLHTGEAGPCISCPSDQLVRNGEPLSTCHWVSRNSATGRTYRCTDKAIRWQDGRLVRLGIAVDVTE